MKTVSIKNILLCAFLLTSLILVAFPQTADAEETGPIRLYPHSAGSLDTIPPTSAEQLTIESFSFSSQEDKIYTLTYPLTRDVVVSGSSGDIMILHLAGSQSVMITDDFELDVRLFGISPSGSDVQIAGGIFQGADMDAADLELSMTDPSGMEISKGSELEIRISLIGDITQASQIFSYRLITSSDNTYLELGLEPLREEDIEIDLTDENGIPLEEILSNGPASSRTFNIMISVGDAFGAYDVAEINILVLSETGNSIWNQTGEPDGDGGDEFAYLNLTHTINEGTPEGTYMVLATVRSLTGFEVVAESELSIASGLYVTILDPDRDADAGETVEFTMSILNGGEGTDRVTFEYSSEKGWNGEVPDPSEIDGGDTVEVTFRIFVPIKSSVGDTDEITLSAISRNADKTYSKVASIYVEKATYFGVSPVGETTSSVVSGGGAQFTVEIVNIRNVSNDFEVGIEDMPSGWSVSYGGANGTLQGSLYIVEIGGDDEATLNINIMTDSGSEGVNDLKVFVRERGSSEKKYVYLRIRVVDPERNILTLIDTTDTKSSKRVGTTTPIRYSEVFFNLEIYNPTLSEVGIRINVFGPTDWTLEYDYGSVDLLPGEISYWNISITPMEGEPYSDDPFTVTIELSGTGSGTISQKLYVNLPKVTSLEVSPDKNSPDVKVGGKAFINLTFRNTGNHPVDISVSSEQPVNLIVTMDPADLSIEPGDNGIVRLTIEVKEIEQDGIIEISVNYDFDGKSGSKVISVYAVKRSEGDDGFDPFLIIIGIIVALVVVVAGYYLFTRYQKRGGSRSETVPQRPPPSEIKMESMKRTERRSSARPVRPPERSKAVKQADDLADEILASLDTRKELSGGITVEAEPEVVTAEIVE